MWWECGECGSLEERIERPPVCSECGTAGAAVLALDPRIEGTGTLARERWFEIGYASLPGESLGAE